MILWTNILIPVASMIITVFATIYTVSERVKNENKEKHKPYLVLGKIEQQKKIDEYKYYLTLVGKNINEKNTLDTINKLETIKIEDNLAVSLIIKNIGYGVASNVKFYDLLTGNPIIGAQSTSKEKIQKLFTTLDIGTTEEKQIQAKVLGQTKQVDEIEEPDHCRILCVYQDLNGNTYDFIISINIKTNNTYDFFAYQRTSHSYAKWIKQNKTQYKKIIQNYKR